MEYTVERKIYKIAEPSGDALYTPDDVFEMVREDQGPQEKFLLIALDTKKRVLKKEILFIGTGDMALVACRDIFRSLLQTGATAFIVAHNHPSGDVEPSSHDRKLTEQIQKAAEIMGVQFLDHIIFTGQKYKSIGRL